MLLADDFNDREEDSVDQKTERLRTVNKKLRRKY